jgi:hypothetical protein
MGTDQIFCSFCSLARVQFGRVPRWAWCPPGQWPCGLASEKGSCSHALPAKWDGQRWVVDAGNAL